MSRYRSKTYPNVELSNDFGESLSYKGDTQGSLYVIPTMDEVLAFVDTRLAGDTTEYKLACKRCDSRVSVYADLDKPTTQISCDCSKHRLLREVQAMKLKDLQETYEFRIVCTGERWPVKIDRLTSPSGMKYTGERPCTLEEAIGYFYKPFIESKKRGFRKGPSQ